ncbi:MAG TPA: ATP-dependent DNA helicase, partial [Thermoanaerobaculia bacterium]|nr:ATP-dependent DNA helicase [Thermoanaerobaculia bacterium]
VFQLGNQSYRVLQVGMGTVRVADAKGEPPSIPFWFGEAPARSDELSKAVSDFRAEMDVILSREDGEDPSSASGNGEGPSTVLRCAAAAQDDTPAEIRDYFSASKRLLGVLPTQDTLVLERFFDEAGGMQLVLHAPFGSRINRAWGLALRKRFCRQFNFELQAAATEDAVLLSLGPQHSFPLADVFRYLHPATAKDVLVQAFLDAPVFQTRWRWNTTISLAVPRNRNGNKVAPQLQRMMADDLMAAVFPDAAACFENIPGDRQIPDHPLVNQVVRDCLEEAMDFDGLARVLTRIHAGEITLVARDTPEPSPLCYEILNAKPYAFLDDAPLEERRTQAVLTRRAGEVSEIGALDPSAIARVVDEERPDPRDADELHDALLTAGFLIDVDESLAATLINARRAIAYKRGDGLQPVAISISGRAEARPHVLYVAAERLPEFLAIHSIEPGIAIPTSRQKQWSREDALVELLRGRTSILGPVTARELAASLSVEEREVETALLKLESEGVILRGTFRGPNEWCDRRLLARIHRYTLHRLRAEIEPVSPADFMRFLFAWQHVTPSSRLVGVEGVQAVIEQLDGFEIAAGAWERAVLPARITNYEPSMLDMLCLTGEIGWARLSPAATSVVSATPISIFQREHADAWQSLRTSSGIVLSERAQVVLDTLRTRGACFARDLGNDAEALAELVSAGLIASDGFAGLRTLIQPTARANFAGRWSLIESNACDDAVELQAHALLRRYGIVFRRVLTREPNAAPWRDLARVYRRMEARGDLRGGRFVNGMSGEQFALPEAVERMREIRRTAHDGTMIVVSAADPLNLTGIITPGDRIRAAHGTRIAWRDGVAVSVMEGDYVRPLTELASEDALNAAHALAGRRVAAGSGFVGR